MERYIIRNLKKLTAGLNRLEWDRFYTTLNQGVGHRIKILENQENVKVIFNFSDSIRIFILFRFQNICFYYSKIKLNILFINFIQVEVALIDFADKEEEGIYELPDHFAKVPPQDLEIQLKGMSDHPAPLTQRIVHILVE